MHFGMLHLFENPVGKTEHAIVHEQLTLMRAAPGFTHATRVRTLPAAMRAYHAFGTTSVFEEHGAAGELVRAYKAVQASGALTMRTTLAFSPNWRAVAGCDPDALIEAWGSWLAEPGPGAMPVLLAATFTLTKAWVAEGWPEDAA